MVTQELRRVVGAPEMVLTGLTPYTCMWRECRPIITIKVSPEPPQATDWGWLSGKWLIVGRTGENLRLGVLGTTGPFVGPILKSCGKCRWNRSHSFLALLDCQRSYCRGAGLRHPSVRRSVCRTKTVGCGVKQGEIRNLILPVEHIGVPLTL